jgi:hypothetical protein
VNQYEAQWFVLIEKLLGNYSCSFHLFFFFPPWQLTAIAGDAIFPKPASLINYDLQASKLTSVRWTEMKS